MNAQSKTFLTDDQVLQILAKAVASCNEQATHAATITFHLTAEQIWAIESARRIIKLLCTGVI